MLRTLIALAILLSLPAQAAPADGFVEKYRCPIAEYLERRAADTSAQGRFLVLSPAGEPQNYVQCLFLPDRANLLCEAASGFYFHGNNFLNPAQRAAMARLGFGGDGAAGNYQRQFALTAPVDFDAIAVSILSVLHDVHGATGELDMQAPHLHDAGKMPPVCKPLS